MWAVSGVAEVGRQRQHVAADIPPIGRQRAFEGAGCKGVPQIMKARPRLAWSGSKPETPCQLDEDGREIDRVHGPARREHEQVFVGPAIALPLPEVGIHGPVDAAIQRHEAALAELRMPDQQPVRRQVRQQEAGRFRTPQTGRSNEPQYVMEGQGRDRTDRRQLQRRIHDLSDLGQ